MIYSKIMKSYIRLFIIVIFSFHLNMAVAQRKIGIGVKAGLSIPNLTSGSADNPINSGYGSRLDADIAVHVEFPVSNYFSIQPQLEYSSQGGKKNGTQAFTVPQEMHPLFPPGQVPAYLYANYKSEARINYLLLPVLAKFHIRLKDRWNAYIAGGPFAGLLLNATNTTKGQSLIYLDVNKTQALTSEPQSFDSKDNIENELRKFNAGISGHLGLSYNLWQGYWFLEAGGNFGFIDIQKGDVNGKNKTGAATINIGYQYNL